MYEKKCINFRIGLSTGSYSPKWYWNPPHRVANTDRYKNDGIVRINGFKTPCYTQVSGDFFNKVHDVALAIVCVINSFDFDDMGTLTREEIESHPLWQQYCKIVKKIMIDHKVGKGIEIGPPKDSLNLCWWFPQHEKPQSILGKKIETGKIVEVGHAAYGFDRNVDMFNDDDTLNEKRVREILERPKYTTVFIYNESAF